MPKNLQVNLRTIRVSAGLVIIFILVYIICLTIYNYKDYKNNFSDRVSEIIHAQTHVLDGHISELQDQAVTVAITVSKLADVRNAYFLEDTLVAISTLNSAIRPIVEDIKESLEIDDYKIHFHKPPAVSFLREWNQTGGDDLSGFRYSILHVAETKKPLKCIELGRSGFAIRGISPIFDLEGNYLGSVEVVFQIHDVLIHLKHDANDFSFIVLANKEKLQNVEYPKDEEANIREEFRNHIVLENTIEDSSISIEDLITTEFINNCETSADSHNYSVGDYIYSGYRLLDFSGENVGKIVFVFNQDIFITKAKRKVAIISSITLIIGLTLIFLMILMVKKLTQNFNIYSKSLKIALKDATDAKRDAEQADRSKSEFLANMSHEIRTPLNAILGYSEILEGKIDDKSHLDYLDGIMTSGKSLLRIINDILDLSKIEAGRIEMQMSPSNPYSIIEDFKKVFGIRIEEKGLYFNVNVDDNLPKSLVLDSTRLGQVLFNLIGNAIKFTSEGGITVNVISEEKIDEYSLSTVNLCFEIIDTGMGIPEDQIAEIFEAFKQQKDQSVGKFGGTGLGLTISKRLTEMMGGELFVESKAGEGSKFTIKLNKISIAAMSGDEDDEIIHSDIILKNGKILLVDDVESNRKVVRGFLEKHDVEIIEAENGKIGVEKALEHLPDVILMDIHMPVMSGHEATIILKKDDITKNIPIIALTASVFKHQEAELKELCDSYLRKPVSKKVLINELAEYIEFEKEETETKTKLNGAPESKVSASPKAEVDFRAEIEGLVNSIEIKELLIKQFGETYSTVAKNNSVKKIAEFTSGLVKFSEEHKLPGLKNTALNLDQQAKSFNIKMVKTILNQMKEVFNND